MKLTIEINGYNESDLEEALNEIKRHVSNGFTAV